MTYKRKHTIKQTGLLFLSASLFILAMLVATNASAQSPKQPSSKADTGTKPFVVTFPQQEVTQQFQSLQFIAVRLHRIDMSSKLRDTLDSYMSQMAGLLQKRYRDAFVADSLSKVKKK